MTPRLCIPWLVQQIVLDDDKRRTGRGSAYEGPGGAHMLKTYFSFSGRMSLKNFWLKYNAWYVAITFCLRFAIISDSNFGNELQDIFLVITLWPSLAIMTKRFHDRGKSIWYWLPLRFLADILLRAAEVLPAWALICKIAGYLLVALIGIESQFIPGQDRDNRFGTNPLAGQRWDGSPRRFVEGDLRATAVAAKRPASSAEGRATTGTD
jgi:uncharacterized membrane protein YhaH (DUF805 family)